MSTDNSNSNSNDIDYFNASMHQLTKSNQFKW